VIVREARLRELVRRVLPNGEVSLTGLISFDESAAVTIRLSAEEFATLEATMSGHPRLAMTLRLGGPNLRDLVTRDEGASA
jgi:hypothetical protein